MYDVHDGGRSFRAVTVGGLGLNAIKDAHQVELYIDSVEKLDRMTAASTTPVEVHLTTHSAFTDLMEERTALARRKTGDPHPLVDPGAFRAQLEGLESGAKERLVIERAKVPK